MGRRGKHQNTEAQLPFEEFDYTAELKPEITHDELLNIEENLATLEIDINETEPLIIQNIGTRLVESANHQEFNKKAIEKECRIECSRLKARFVTDIVILFLYASQEHLPPAQFINTVFENEEDTDYIESFKALFSEKDIEK